MVVKVNPYYWGNANPNAYCTELENPKTTADVHNPKIWLIDIIHNEPNDAKNAIKNNPISLYTTWPEILANINLKIVIEIQKSDENIVAFYFYV